MRPPLLSKKLSFNVGLLAAAFLIGAVYVGNAWTPSSYALALRLFQVKDDGLIFGTPRPIRSDEWAVFTPFAQATVNNGLHRINETSLYKEDLRFFAAMPVLDWGLIFKPAMWLYPILDPAYAFSFQHYLYIALFVFGYCLLFQRLALRRRDALLLALTLFFTAFVQFWWTGFGPVMAVFPWLFVVLHSTLRPPWKYALYYWVATVWMLSLFYPPIIISTAFVLLICLLAFRIENLAGKELVRLGTATALACLTVVLYLLSYLSETITTNYPGQRSVSGGTVPFGLWLSHFFPTALIHEYESLIPDVNVCEVSTVGSFYFLTVGCMLRYGRLTMLKPEERRALVFLAAGLLLMSAWLLLPIPNWVGMLLLWNQVQPPRMLFAYGLLMLITAAYLSSLCGICITVYRALVLAGIGCLGWFVWKSGINQNVLSNWADFMPVLFAIALLALKKIPASQATLQTSVAALSFGASIYFAGFNPLQSAWPIFHRETTSVTRLLDVQTRSEGFLAVFGFPGATLNSWGYSSVSHVNYVPALRFWREKFPEMEASKFDYLFNRYSHIILTDKTEPYLILPDAVGVPITLFSGPQYRQVTVTKRRAMPTTVNGYVDHIEVKGQEVIISGWAPWRQESKDQTLTLTTSSTVRSAQYLGSFPRPDVAQHLGDAAYLRAGFSVRLNLDASDTFRDLCVIASGDDGEVALFNGSEIYPCRMMN